MIEQADTAVRAVVDLRIVQVDCSFAAGADVLAQARQCSVVGQFLAPFGVGFGLSLALSLQVAIQRDDGLAADQHGDQDAHGMPHITAIARQVGHQFDEEDKQREENKSPDKGPPGASTLAGEQPAGGDEKRQGQRQPVDKHSQFLALQRIL